MQISGIWVCVSNCSGHAIQDLSCETCACQSCSYEGWNNCSCDYCYELLPAKNTDINSTSTRKPDNSNNKLVIAASVGGAIGGCVLVGFIIVAIIFCYRHWARQSHAQSSGTVGKNVQDIRTGAVLISNTDKNASQLPSSSSSMPRSYENQTLPGKDFSTKVLQQNDVVLRYTKDPTEHSTKPNQPQDVGEKIYENHDSIELTKKITGQDLANATESVLSKLLEEVEIVRLGSAPEVPSTKKMAGTFKRDESHDHEVYVDMNNHNISQEGDYVNIKNISKAYAGGSENEHGKEDQKKSSERTPTVVLKPQRASKTDLSVTVGNESDLEDYENTKELKKLTVLDKNKTNDTLAVANSISKRKENDADLDDYNNTCTKELSKKTGSSTKAVLEKANKNKVNESEAKENDCGLDDYENVGPLQVKTLAEVNNKTNNVAEIKTGNVKVERKDSSTEYNTVTAPDKNVTSERDDDFPYQNMAFVRKK